MSKLSGYRLQKRDGAVVAIVRGGNVLLLKRRRIPFIANPGLWCLVMGGRSGKESYIENAYREVEEETGIGRSHLMLLAKKNNVRLFDAVRNDKVAWENAFLIFHSDTNEVRKNFENSAFRWATISEIIKEREYTNIFVDKEEITKLIKGAIDASRKLER